MKSILATALAVLALGLWTPPDNSAQAQVSPELLEACFTPEAYNQGLETMAQCIAYQFMQGCNVQQNPMTVSQAMCMQNNFGMLANELSESIQNAWSNNAQLINICEMIYWNDPSCEAFQAEMQLWMWFYSFAVDAYFFFQEEIADCQASPNCNNQIYSPYTA